MVETCRRLSGFNYYWRFKISDSHPRELLLSVLAQDGRASVEALARSTGLSTGQIRQLLRELTSDGVEVRGIMHPSVFGQHALAHVLISPTLSVRATIDVLVAMPEIPYVTQVAGEFSIAAEIRVADRAALGRMIERITALPEVRQLYFDEYFDIVKDAIVRVRRRGEIMLDATDRVLLRELQLDGRAPFAALARRVNLSTASARARVLRLLDSGVINIGIRTRSQRGSLQIGFRLFGTPSDTVADALLTRGSVEYLATSMGRSNFIGTIRVPTLAVAAAELAAIQVIPGVSDLSSWVHLEIVKEHYEFKDLPA